jgi:formate--tetrahydrofolate ligase
VHAGPFANIAHGTSSVIAARTALGLADWVITEAGFGFDLGGEKFFDIVVPASGLAPAAVVIVATVRALRMHGGRPLDQVGSADLEAVERGLPNLRRHVDSAGRFGRPIVVALNAFPGDRPDEVAAIEAACRTWGAGFARIEAATRGGEGGTQLAEAVIAAVEAARELPPPPTLYPHSAGLVAKVEAVARTLYGARRVVVSDLAAGQIADLERLGFGNLPVCIAKTQSSFTDDPTILGAPTDFDLTIRRVELAAGAGFVVILAGSIMRMPGLPREPRALEVDLVDGEIHGIG